MGRQDQITKRKGRVANNVSHSKRRTKRRQELNLQNKRFFIPGKGWVKVKLSTRTIRTITKKGAEAVLNV